MTHRSRLLLVGIDSATLDLIQPWAERGELPAMGRVMKAGAFGRLRSVANMMTPGAWTSFATGYNPGKHGIFWFTERVPGSYEERLIRGSARAGTPFWILLSQAGVTCTVVDVPMTFPADRVNGVMISGMDAPSPEAPGFTHPPDLAVELQHRFNTLFGAASIYEVIGDPVLARRLDTVREILEQRVAVRTELARYLMDRYPADFFCIVHMEVDIIRHYFWKFTEPQMPRDTRQARRLQGKCGSMSAAAILRDLSSPAPNTTVSGGKSARRSWRCGMRKREHRDSRPCRSGLHQR